uniref:MLO-like protein n=2 Tax=Populus TaxID=3689 RepID=A0A4U5QL06_POPAL|nr:MLO-like protein 3 [Populus alba]
MAVGGASSTGPTPYRSLQDTPTWALATVCFVFIFTGIFIEYLIHLLSHWLKKSRKTALYEALEKLKSVLMVLGFMSLILTVTQRSIIKICISDKVANRMLPCRQTITKTTKATQERILAAESGSDYCGSRGMTSLISQSGVNQLNIFICVIAIMQILHTVLTMALGRAKIRSWKAWERETQTVEYQAANDAHRFRYTRQTTFARRHMGFFTATSAQLWIKCFFRQFFSSVAKVDYLTLRHGFLAAHFPNNSSFNFQRYIQRSLDDDFKEIVGISPWMWFLVVIFMLVDVYGWHAYLWVSFIPLLIVLVLGTKLEVVVAEMALEIRDQSSVIKGAPLVRPDNSLFWFSHPKYVLPLIHFTLFMNAFELAFFVWVTLQFGIKSCYHEKVEITAVRVVLAVTVQIMCSYITLPLYALVTQMGSQLKGAILEERTANAIKQWYGGVKKKMKKKRQDVSLSNYHSYSPPVSTSNRTMDSLSDNSHHHSQSNSQDDIPSLLRNPTLSDITPFHGQIEMVENGAQEIPQHVVPSTVIEIAGVPDLIKNQT